MSGLDRLLAQSLEVVIRKNLGDKTVKKIEKRLFEKYGVSLTQSMDEFQKLDAILREFFGAGTDGLERKFLEPICSTKSLKKDGNWITLDDSVINGNILEAFGDDDKKNILNASTSSSFIIADILKKCKIPQTSGYRKINSLIKNGLLISDGFINGTDGKKIVKYRTLFENTRININKNKVSIDIQLHNADIGNSSILQIISN